MRAGKGARKSGKVTLGLVATLAAVLLVGCDSDAPRTTRVCVDKNNAAVDDKRCEDQPRQSSGGGAYMWYYLSHGGSPGSPASYPIGSRVAGGSFTAPSAGIVSSRSGAVVSRGGFGSSAAGHGVAS